MEKISTIIEDKYVFDYINPASSANLFIDGVKRDFVMIDFEEYNNYMRHIAYSNKILLMI